MDRTTVGASNEYSQDTGAHSAIELYYIDASINEDSCTEMQ